MLGLSPTPRPRKACSGSSSPSAREEWGRSCTGWRRPTSSNARFPRSPAGSRNAFSTWGEPVGLTITRSLRRRLRSHRGSIAINDTVLRKIVHGNAAGEKKEAKKCGRWRWCLLWQ
jgi:hypothetical protein